MESFDLRVSVKGIDRYLHCRKCYGLYLANEYGLPVVTSGFVYQDPEEILVQDEKIYLCRPDASGNYWRNLPRGRDLTPEGIPAFLMKCQQISPKAILLCLEHPSIALTGTYVERYNISGGVNILVNWFSDVVIEYVGQGFDVGELTRGTNICHERLIVSWNDLYDSREKIFQSCIRTVISREEYRHSRDVRIRNMEKLLGYKRDVLERSIPQSSSTLSFDQFNNIMSQCVLNICSNYRKFNTDNYYVILANLYGNKASVVEIWEMNR